MLNLEGVKLAFGGAVALDGVDLAVGDGEAVGLIGPNGSGKSSLFNVVTGIYRPDAGRILLQGEEIGGLAPHQIVARGVARTVQSTRTFERLTVFDNVRAVMGARPSEAEALLEEVGLAGRRDRMAGELAFAERRRLDLARALALRPKLLLLDEPAGALTAAESEAMIELLARVAMAGRTVVIVEHKLDLISALCSRVAVLHLGRKIAEGPPHVIAGDPLVREVYFGSGDEARHA